MARKGLSGGHSCLLPTTAQSRVIIASTFQSEGPGMATIEARFGTSKMMEHDLDG